uniref:Ig-like domain-containing protein n=1 Tax=Terrapene triunguis TaxID=2587831 RepID=A0A674IKT6_9SAUR
MCFTVSVACVLSLFLTRCSAQLTCEQTYGHNSMFWYQQDLGQGLQLLISFYDKKLRDKGNVTDRFQAERPQTELLHLDISPMEPEDSAVYFCLHNGVNSERQYFGDGTKLTVLGKREARVVLAIFPPSKQEIKEKGKATLVCLATKFYPDHIKLFWEVNDAEREDGVRTDEFSTWDETSKSYSLTSRLRISTQEWFNSKNSFRCAVKFHLDEIQYEVIRGGDGE